MAFLFGGVPPVAPPSDVCSKAAFHAAPATETEWRAVTFDIERLRVHRRDATGSVELEETRWTSDALLGLRAPGKSGERQPQSGPDSLAIPWSEIERIERPGHLRVGEGMAVGAIVGLVVGLVAMWRADDEPCGDTFCIPGEAFAILLTVPIGALVGAGVGSGVRSWKPVYCATSGSTSNE